MTSEKYIDTAPGAAPERSDQFAAIPTVASQAPKGLHHIHRNCSSAPTRVDRNFQSLVSALVLERKEQKPGKRVSPILASPMKTDQLDGGR